MAYGRLIEDVALPLQIIPLIDGTRLRLGNIPDTAWHDPYVIGFLGMLITFIATRSTGALDTDDLAAVQAGAWTDITGMPGDLVGEEHVLSQRFQRQPIHIRMPQR